MDINILEQKIDMSTHSSTFTDKDSGRQILGSYIQVQGELQI